MQSDGNSFGGDVVLDSVNMAFSYKDSILDLIRKAWKAIIFESLLIFQKDFNSNTVL